MANEQGIWRLLLTTRNEIPAAVEKDIAALNKLERKAETSGGTLRKAIGKAGGALGVGSALEGGGGLRTTFGIGLAVALGAGFRAAAEEAMAADLAAQNAAKSIREQYGMSAAAVASLNDVSLSGVEASTRFKAALGEIVATVLASVRYLGAAGLNLGAGIGRAMGIDMSPTEAVVDRILTDYFKSAPSWMGGVGGDNSGGLAVAEAKLAEAQKRRKEEDAKRTAVAPRTPTAIAFDEYARMGLFIGGRSAVQETNQILRDQKTQLERLNSAVDQLAPRIADNL